MLIPGVQPDHWSLSCEARQLRDEGFEVEPFLAAVERLKDADFSDPEVRARADRMLSGDHGLQRKPGTERWEPSDWPALQGFAESAGVQAPPKGRERAERLRGAWVGRAAGCYWGKPLEGVRRHEWVRLAAESGLTPLRRMLHTLDVSGPVGAEIAARHWGLGRFLPDILPHAPADDDLNYCLLALTIL
ncbi:MAG: hypothetical protein MH204_08345, partial [Fimbriimonadaceae bacterium]|nr:hypothetical protein [Fimbriimonadaceae bacterium]